MFCLFSALMVFSKVNVSDIKSQFFIFLSVVMKNTLLQSLHHVSVSGCKYACVYQ